MIHGPREGSAIRPKPVSASNPGDRNGTFDIWAMDANAGGTGLTQLTSGQASDGYPVFSADGTRIVFIRDQEVWTMDADGTKNGFDLELTRAVAEAVNIPVIASGGAGRLEHFLEAVTIGKAEAALAALKALGIDLNAVAEKLQQDGVAAFAASFDQLMAALEKKRKAMTGVELNRQELQLGKYHRRVRRRTRCRAPCRMKFARGYSRSAALL